MKTHFALIGAGSVSQHVQESLRQVPLRMRLFFALRLPNHVLRQMDDVREAIPGVRWIPNKSTHLTVEFLGEVESSMTAEIVVRTMAAVMTLRPFSVLLGPGGVFPNERRPTVLWMGVEAGSELFRLQQNLHNAMNVPGIHLENRPFKPHVTLGRVRRGARVDVSGWLARYQTFRTESFSVAEFHLISSELRPTGALYRTEKTFGLRDTTSG